VIRITVSQHLARTVRAAAGLAADGCKPSLSVEVTLVTLDVTLDALDVTLAVTSTLNFRRQTARGPLGREPGDAPSLSLLDSAQAAYRLGVTERLIRRLVAERRIPFVRVGRFVRFDPDDIDAWIEEAKVAVTPQRHHGGPRQSGGRT